MNCDIRIVASVNFQDIYTVVTGELMLLLKWQSRKSQSLCRYLKHVMRGASHLWNMEVHEMYISTSFLWDSICCDIWSTTETNLQDKSLMAIVLFGSVYTQDRYRESVMQLGQQALCRFMPLPWGRAWTCHRRSSHQNHQTSEGRSSIGRHKVEMCYSQSVLGIMRTVQWSRHRVYGWA